MPSILIVEKLGNVKTLQVKTYAEDELYKKAGLKSPEGFKLHTSWKVDIENKKFTICLYGKTTGRANQENKFEFPPPIDNTLFFGNCILVKKSEDETNVLDLGESEWETIYEKLYGGFEDVGNEDSDDEDSDDEDDVPRTKDGYVKDGFVVDDDNDEDEDEEDEDEEDEPVVVKKSKKSAKPAKVVTKTIAKKIQAIRSVFELESIKSIDADPVPPVEPTPANYLNCTNELTEEEYEE